MEIAMSVIISILIWFILVAMIAYGEYNPRPKWHEWIGYLVSMLSALGFIYLIVHLIISKIIQL